MLSHRQVVDEHESQHPGVRTPLIDNDAFEIGGAKNEYDLFEEFPNGSSLWRGSVSGFEDTRLRLQELGEKSANHFYAISLTAGEDLVFDVEPDIHGLPAPLKVERRTQSQAA
jgi:hypothetical protein